MIIKEIDYIPLFLTFIIVLIVLYVYTSSGTLDRNTDALNIVSELNKIDDNCERSKFIIDNKDYIIIEAVIDAKEYYESFCLGVKK